MFYYIAREHDQLVACTSTTCVSMAIYNYIVTYINYPTGTQVHRPSIAHNTHPILLYIFDTCFTKKIQLLHTYSASLRYTQLFCYTCNYYYFNRCYSCFYWRYSRQLPLRCLIWALTAKIRACSAARSSTYCYILLSSCSSSTAWLIITNVKLLLRIQCELITINYKY